MDEDDAKAGWEVPVSRWRGLGVAARSRWMPRAVPGVALAPITVAGGIAPDTMAVLRARVRQIADPATPGVLPPPAGREEEEHGRRAPAPPPLALLDPQLQRHLEQFLRFRLPAIRIDTGVTADRLVRRFGADAVTARDTVYFRSGAFRPDTQEGRALLAHEATHIAWGEGARPTSRRAAPAGEEQVATANERRYRIGRQAIPLRTPEPGRRPSASPPASPHPPTVAIRTAMSSRDLDAEAEAATSHGEILSDTAIRVLKADLYRSILDTLRSEFERGG